MYNVNSMNIPNPHLLVSQTFNKNKIEFVWNENNYWTILQSHRNGKKVILSGKGEDFDSIDFRIEALGYFTPELLKLHEESVAYLKSI